LGSFLPSVVLLALAAPAPETSDVQLGLATLYPLDPLAHTLSFADGAFGNVFEANVVKDRDSDLDAEGYLPGEFSAAFDFDQRRRAVIVDLGSASELARRYGYSETIGGGQGFASIHRRGRSVFVLRSYFDQTFQRLNESRPLFDPGVRMAHAPIRLGHVYLVRITDATDGAFERLVKLQVVEVEPGQRVTVRWQRL
jgi:hypothetical protein